MFHLALAQVHITSLVRRVCHVRFLDRACLFGVTLMFLGLGCTAYSVPPSLSDAEKATVVAAKTGLVAAIRSTRPDEVGDPEYYDSFRSSMRETGLFSRVAFDWQLETEPDVTIEPLYPCDLEEEIGAVMPLLPLLSFGLVPMLIRGSYHWAFTIERHERRVTVDCPVKGTFGMGWLPWILRLTPKWTGDARYDPRTQERVTYELAKALGSLPPPP